MGDNQRLGVMGSGLRLKGSPPPLVGLKPGTIRSVSQNLNIGAPKQTGNYTCKTCLSGHL